MLSARSLSLLSFSPINCLLNPHPYIRDENTFNTQPLSLARDVDAAFEVGAEWFKQLE